MVTVKGLINELLDCEMYLEIEVRDIHGYKLPETKLVAVKPEGLKCILG